MGLSQSAPAGDATAVVPLHVESASPESASASGSPASQQQQQNASPSSTATSSGAAVAAASSGSSNSANNGVALPCPGLKNYDNSCFINATAQLLYHCTSFRNAIVANGGAASSGDSSTTALRSLAELFVTISTSGKSVVSPKTFVNQVREEFGFPKGVHQDAHEFLARLLSAATDAQRRGLSDEKEKCPLQRLVEGTLTSELACIECETSTTRSEAFPFISLEIEQNSSLVGCLTKFFAAELLCGSDKSRCECCCAAVCARKTFEISESPRLLFVQLKRFHFSPETNTHRKLAYRVSIPHQLGVPFTARGGEQLRNGVAAYRLKGFVVHHGVSLSYGHYYACVRCDDGKWRCFDDDKVAEMSERDIVRFFGSSAQSSNASSATAYLVLYERLYE